MGRRKWGYRARKAKSGMWNNRKRNRMQRVIKWIN